MKLRNGCAVLGLAWVAALLVASSLSPLAAAGTEGLQVDSSWVWIEHDAEGNPQLTFLVTSLSESGGTGAVTVYEDGLLLGEKTLEVRGESYLQFPVREPQGVREFLILSTGLRESFVISLEVFPPPRISIRVPQESVSFLTGSKRVVPVEVEVRGQDVRGLTLAFPRTAGVGLKVVSPVLDLAAGTSGRLFVEFTPGTASGTSEVGLVPVLQAVAGAERSEWTPFPMIVQVPSGTTWVGPVAVTAISALSVALLGGSEIGRYKILSLLMPLYSKLSKEDVLDQYTRGKIHGYILANPGEHFNGIRKALYLNNGTVTYHLRVLEREGHVQSRVEGIYRRFYPGRARLPEMKVQLNATQTVLLQRVRIVPGITQKVLAQELGVHPSTVSYHMEGMIHRGLVDRRRRGIAIGYYATHPDAVKNPPPSEGKGSSEDKRPVPG